MQRVGPKAKYRISQNIVAFMIEGTPLTIETKSFIYTWVRQPDGNGRSQSFCDVWKLVLQNYLPKERPVLFHVCTRPSIRPIQSFTGTISAAYKLSRERPGHLLICDTREYLYWENESTVPHERSFFPLRECVEKAMNASEPVFSESFYEICKKEDEYIVLANLNCMYDLKWNKK